MNSQLLEIQRMLANAGSGKTFVLSSRYLEIAYAGLLEGDPSRVESILATTFTKAAAAQIRNKVLLRAADAVLCESSRKQLSEIILGDGNCATFRAHDLLDLLVARLDRLEIRTLDGFFARIARAYALEMGIPPDAVPLDDAAKRLLQLDALTKVINDDSAMAGNLLNIADRYRASRDPVDQICRNISAWISIWDDSDAQSSKALGDTGIPPAWLSEEELAPLDVSEARVALEKIEAWSTQEPKAHQKAHAEFSEVCRGQIERTRPDLAVLAGLFKVGIPAKLIAGERDYKSKSLTDEQAKAYWKVLGWIQYQNSREGVIGLGATARLLGCVSGALQDALRSAGACTFESITRTVAAQLNADVLDDILLRLDARVNHLLLDEFQDTSLAQWGALKPLAQSIAAGSDCPRSLLVVGDVKQSIYGWRNADPRLLRELPKLLSEGQPAEVKDRSLSTSWRSSPVVLAFVDQLFESLADPGHPLRDPDEKTYSRPLIAAMDKWLGGYQHHKASPNHQSMAGHVELVQVDTEKGGKEEQYRRAGVLANELWHRSGGTKSIGVIAARNKDVGEIAQAIRNCENPAPCAVLAGGQLQTSPAAVAIVDALRFATHPEDSVSLMSVVASPLGPVLELDASLVGPEKSKRARRSAASHRLRRQLWSNGPTRTVSAWIDGLESGPSGSSLDSGDRHRATSLVEEVARADARGDSLEQLIASLDAVRVQDVPSSAIHAINIHQAKGLEWDIVIFAPSAQTVSMRGPIAVGRGGEFTDIGSGRIAPYMTKGTAVPEVQVVIDSADCFSYQEFLSCLYVAVTRAKQGLWVVLPSPPKSGSLVNRSHAGLLRHAFARCTDQAVDLGSDAWVTERSSEESKQAIEIIEAPLMPAAPKAPRSDLLVAPSASSLSESSRATADSMDSPDPRITRRALTKGTVAHLVCESIEWSDGWTPDIERLVDRALRGARWMDSAEVRTIVTEVVAQVRCKAIVEALARPHSPAVALRERGFMHFGSRGEVSQGSIDRLVLHGTPDGWTGAEIFDFKTDHPPAGAPASWAHDRLEHHRPQLDAYIAAVEQQYPSIKGKVVARVILLSTGQVLQL